MFLTNNYSIREVLAFPFLREEKNGPKQPFAAELANVEPMPEEGIRKSIQSRVADAYVPNANITTAHK